MKNKIYVLGIETSCDETAVSVVENGKYVLSNIINSQIKLHKEFGGVVPEIASRNHINNIALVVDEALKEASLKIKDIDCIAVTNKPGLEGSLLVGLSYAKGLAYANNKNLCLINHIDGHISANYIESDFKPPFNCLVVSGGHTKLVYVKNYCEHEVLGSTRDDAIGETYDKIARVLELDYPGGPIIDNLSKKGNKNAIEFKRVLLDKNSLDFSFSGLKSNVINYINTAKMKNDKINIEDICASFQEAAIDVLVKKSLDSIKLKNINKFAICGGVSANTRLRERISEMCEYNKIQLNIPKPIFCTDNGAMIAVAGYYKYINKLNE